VEKKQQQQQKQQQNNKGQADKKQKRAKEGKKTPVATNQAACYSINVFVLYNTR
jgi:flagellar hook-length control protein FliK